MNDFKDGGGSHLKLRDASGRSLSNSADKFIRDFYYGGRVEIFHLGRVPGDKIYYYDFTSLYPAMGIKYFTLW